MVCPNCKKPVSADMRFCGECGCRLEPAVEKVTAPESVIDVSVEEKVEPEIVVNVPVEEKIEPESVIDAPVEEETEITAAMDADVEDASDEKENHLARLEQMAKEGAQKATVLAKEGAQKAGVFAKKTGKQMEKLAKEGAVKAEKLAKEGAVKAEQMAKEGAEKAKKLPKNVRIIAMAVAAVLVLVVGIAVLSAVFGGGGTDSYALYIKEQEIHYSDFGKESLEVTSRLLDDSYLDAASMAEGSYYLSAYTVLCENRLFYPDKVSSDTEGFTIYYRDLNRKKEAQKLDSEIISYAVSENGKEVLYLKGSDGKLYRSNLKDKEKLASDVSFFMVADNLDRILYVTEDMSVYTMNAKGDKEKVVSEVDELSHVSEDLQTLYYVKEGNLYTQKVGQDRVKIASDVENVIHVWEDGKMYYTTCEYVEMNLWDYIDDDMAQEDAMLTEPEYPEYPDAPDYPYSWNYDSEEAYDQAQAEYEEAYANYEALCQEIEQSYNDALEAYWAKQDRDSLRESIESYLEEYDVYTLHYYDGKESAEVVGNLTSGWVSDYAVDAPVAVVTAYGDVSEVNVKLSQMGSIWDVTDQIYTQRNEGSVYYVVSGSSTMTASTEMEIYDIYVSNDGKQVAITAEVDEEGTEGELYTAKVQTGREITPEKLDEDVYPGYVSYLSNGKLAYFKDMDRYGESGDLYIEGKNIDTDVYTYSLNYSDILGAMIYYCDYDDGDQMGTLTICKNKTPEKVSDDVYAYQVNEAGQLYYLYDYSDRHYTGELYLLDGSKPKKIDEDVTALLYTPGKPGEVCGFNYYWW